MGGGANSGEFRVNSPESGKSLPGTDSGKFRANSGPIPSDATKKHRLGRIRPNWPESQNPTRANPGKLARIHPNGFASGLNRLGHGWLESPRRIRADVRPDFWRNPGDSGPIPGVVVEGWSRFGRISGGFRANSEPIPPRRVLGLKRIWANADKRNVLGHF